MAASKKNPASCIYLIPLSHYDVVWVFNKEDYLRIHEMILRIAVRMIREEGFKFIIEQSYLLEQIERRDPLLFRDIKEAIAKGHIEIVDGQYMMPDTMIPGGEVLIREILYGKKYCKESFGKDVPVAWASDGFGLNAQLPQIYKKCGYKWLAFRRGMPRFIGSKVSEFIWEGLDGSQITSHWMPMGYRAGLWIDKWEERYEQLSKLATTCKVLMPCGSGGTPPQEDIPEAVAKWNRKKKPKIVVATPSEFFEAFDKEEKKLIVHKGELYSADLENIFPDVVSCRSSLKLKIRRRENWLVMSEKAASIAWLAGKPYPQYAFRQLWKKMLFLAMHDVLPTTGIDEIYEEAWNYIRELKETTRQLLRDSIRYLISEKSHGHSAIVFNSNNWDVTNWVEMDITVGEGWHDLPVLFDRGKKIPTEIIEVDYWDNGDIRSAKLGFMASVPALGSHIYPLGKQEKKGRPAKRAKLPKESDSGSVSTKLFNIVVEHDTGVLHVYDKKNNELVKGNELIIDQEIGDLYFHHSIQNDIIASESGGGQRFGAFKPEFLKVERGEARTVISYKSAYYCLRWPYYLTEKFGPMLYRHKTVDILKQVIIYDDIPRIDCHTELDLHQSHVRLRLKFDTGMVTPKYSRQTQFGVLPLPKERMLEGSMKIPSLAWINCEERGRGLAFLTQGVPINEIKGGLIYCTLLRSVSVLSADGVSGPLIPTPGAMELGHHSYDYSILPYEGKWQERNIHRAAYEVAFRLLALQMDTAPEQLHFQSFKVEPDNLIVSAIKLAEEADSLIFRFFESKGKKCQAIISLPEEIEKVFVTDMLENKEKEIKIHNHQIKMNVGHFEIVTLRMYKRHKAKIE